MRCESHFGDWRSDSDLVLGLSFRLGAGSDTGAEAAEGGAREVVVHRSYTKRMTCASVGKSRSLMVSSRAMP